MQPQCDEGNLTPDGRNHLPAPQEQKISVSPQQFTGHPQKRDAPSIRPDSRSVPHCIHRRSSAEQGPLGVYRSHSGADAYWSTPPTPVLFL